jgi:hypothetical protein
LSNVDYYWLRITMMTMIMTTVRMGRRVCEQGGRKSCLGWLWGGGGGGSERIEDAVRGKKENKKIN